MKWSQIALQLLLSLTAAPGLEARESSVATSRPERTPEGPISATWVAKHARLKAQIVRLRGIGVRTHANWVLFQLPFDTTKRDRVRSVSFRPSSATPTEVGALRIGSVCVNVRPAGEVEEWARYTVGGIGYTLRFSWHPGPPTTDPSMLGINVPTRVANYSACDLDDGHLKDAENWSLEVDWEER